MKAAIGVAVAAVLVGAMLARAEDLAQVERRFDERKTAAVKAIDAERVAAIQAYLDQNPKAADREAARVRLVDLLAEQERPELLLQAAAAYHGEFPRGEQRDQVYLRELAAACSDPALLNRAAEILKAYEKDPADPSAVVSIRIYVADAYLEKDRLEDARRLLQATPALPTSKENQELAEELKSRLAALDMVGKPFDDFRVEGLTGETLSVERLKGKVVLVDFWATWCGPCRTDLPSVVALYGKYHEAGLEIIGINLDDDTSSLTGFLASNGVTWAQHADGKAWENALVEKYAITGIPETILIGRDGKVFRRGLRGGALEAAVRKLLESKLAQS